MNILLNRYCQKLYLCSLTCYVVLLFIMMVSFTSYANKISGHFVVKEKIFDFSKSTISEKCTGKIPYPFLDNEDGELTTEINNEILDFMELYNICNEGNHANFEVSFDMPTSGSNDYFSIRWITKKDGKIYRIDCLNFNINNENLLTIDDIFNDMSETVVGGLAKLSEGVMSANIRWEGFLNMIGKREIQFYLKNNEWYIIFNGNQKVVETKIPKYFLENR